MTKLDKPLQFSNGVAWHPTGIRIEIQRASGDRSDRVLSVDSLNPQTRAVHLMSRWDCFRLGVLIAWRAILAHTPHEAHTKEPKA